MNEILINTNIDNRAALNKLNQLNRKILDMRQNLNTLNAQRSPLVESMARLGAELDSAKAKLYEMQQMAENNPIWGYQNESAISEQSALVDALQRDFDAAANAVEKMDAKIASAKTELASSEQFAGQLRQEISNMPQPIERTEKGTRKLGLNLAMLPKHSKRATSGIEKLTKKILGMVKTVFVFQLIRTALRSLGTWLGNVFQADTQLAQSLAQLKGAFATMAAPIIQAVIPISNSLVGAITRVVSALASLVSFLFGKTLSSSKQAAQTYTNQAKGIKSVGSAAKDATKQLAAFDEINQLTDNSGGGGETGGASFDFADTGTGLGEMLKNAWANADFTEVGRAIALKTAEALNNATEWMKSSFGPFMDKVATSLATFINGFSSEDTGLPQALGRFIGTGLNESIGTLDTFITKLNWAPLGSGLVNSITSFIKTFSWSGLFKTLSDGIKGVLDWLIGAIGSIDFFELAESIDRFFTAALEDVDWVGIGIRIIGLLEIVAAQIVAGIGEVIGRIFQGIVEWVIEGARILKEEFGIAGMDSVIGFLSGISDALGSIGTWLKENLVDPIVNGVKNLLGIHSPSTVFAEIGHNMIAGLLNGLTGRWQSVMAFFASAKLAITTAWTAAMNAVKSVTTNIWNSITGGIKSAINNIIGFLNRMLSGFASGFNGLVGRINSLSFNLPGFLGGGHVGFNLPTIPTLSIPYLASGSVIPPNREFMAMLGDNKKETEVVSPLSTMQEALTNALAQSGFGEQTVVLELDGTELGRVIYKLNRDESRRLGLSLAGV